jgi:2-phospho-L-lactate/phosphoenolpyruvate guanylyltransferase
MRTVAVLPVKSFPRAKSRTELPGEDRAALAESMLVAVLRALAGLEVIMVTREPRAIALAGHATVVHDEHEAGHNAAALLGIRAARGAERVLLVPGDCPLLDPAELERLLGEAGPGVTIVPDRHGTGTNALVLDPPDVMAPSFGPGSCARHAALAAGAGARVRIVDVPSLAFDVDTPEDLAVLRQAA